MSNEKVSSGRQKTAEEIKKAEAEKRRRQELSKLDIHYKSYRKAALNEERLDYYGEENVPTTSREKFFELINREFKLGKFIPDSDVTLIKNALYTHDEFIDKNKIKFIVQHAYKTGGLTKVEHEINELSSLLRNTKYTGPIQEFKGWLKAEKISVRIRELRNAKYTSEQIIERLHITSAELRVYSDSSKKVPELLENETR